MKLYFYSFSDGGRNKMKGKDMKKKKAETKSGCTCGSDCGCC